jgi:hypothetical protein
MHAAIKAETPRGGQRERSTGDAASLARHVGRDGRQDAGSTLEAARRVAAVRVAAAVPTCGALSLHVQLGRMHRRPFPSSPAHPRGHAPEQRRMHTTPWKHTSAAYPAAQHKESHHAPD